MLLAFLFLLFTSQTFAAIYEQFDDLPTRNFDFIVVGGLDTPFIASPDNH
jgi:hypothetical protein